MAPVIDMWAVSGKMSNSSSVREEDQTGKRHRHVKRKKKMCSCHI